MHLATATKIDLIHLNYLIKQNPALAHEIVSTGLLIVDKKPSEQKQYKEMALLCHFDNADLNSKMMAAFKRRVKDRKIGVRNYAK